jgi:hypothetical protein
MVTVILSAHRRISAAPNCANPGQPGMSRAGQTVSLQSLQSLHATTSNEMKCIAFHFMAVCM